MINTWGELWAAVKKWLDTPLKWERKAKEEVKKETKSVLDWMTDPEAQKKARERYQQALLEQERAAQRARDFERRINGIRRIPFCEKCKDVGCEECSQWPMNQ